MSQVTDYVVSGTPLTMAELATELGEMFAAAASENRGATAPSTPFEGMLWQDSAATPVEYIKKYTVTFGWVTQARINITTGEYVLFSFGRGVGDSAKKFTAGGTADAITGTLDPAITAYAAGMRVKTTIATPNTTTTPTLDLNSIGAATIKKYGPGGTLVALGIGDLSGICDLETDGTDFILVNASRMVSDGSILTVASAAAPDIWAGTSEIVSYTGTVTATDLADAPRAGMKRTLICAAAAPFTDGSGITILGFPAGYTYTAQAGELIDFYSTSTTAFTMVTRPRAGFYTPTAYNTLNVGASTVYEFQWSQNRDIISVSGTVDIDPTTASVPTALDISTPYNPNFTALDQCNGSFSSSLGGSGRVYANISVGETNRITLRITPSLSTNVTYGITFSYRIIS